MSLRDVKINDYELDAEFLTGVVVHTIKPPTRDTPKRPNDVTKQRWVWRRNIAAGAFGSVVLEKEESDGRFGTNSRAVKTIKKSLLHSQGMDWESEVESLIALSKFQNLFVDFYGWYSDDFSIYLAMEYFPLGDLSSIMNADIGEDSTQQITWQLTQGLNAMHEMNMAHRDLKPANILISARDPAWHVKIGDFGFAKRLRSQNSKLVSKVGTSGYQAPEILDYVHEHEESSEYSSAIDIWSLGCIVYELLTQLLPFSRGGTLLRYCDGRAKFPLDPLQRSRVSPQAIAFVQHLLQARSEMRPSALLLLSDPWLSEPRQKEERSVRLVHESVSARSQQSSSGPHGRPRSAEHNASVERPYRSSSSATVLREDSLAYERGPSPRTSEVHSVKLGNTREHPTPPGIRQNFMNLWKKGILLFV